MPNDLKVVSWNVLIPAFAENNGFVLDALEQMGEPDVVCLQEYVQGKDEMAKEWFDAHDYDTAYLPFANQSELGEVSQGVMTATKKVLEALVKPVVLREDDPQPNRPFRNIRGLLDATVKIGDAEVSIMNFHATYPRPHTIDMRKREFSGLIRYLGTKSTESPWLLCGDFNFVGLDKRRKYLVTRYKNFTGGPIDKTWRHDPIYSPLRANIDYFFWEGLGIEAELGKFSTSDHRPIIANVAATKP